MTSNDSQKSTVVVSSRLLEAFLACPVKCRFIYEGDIPAGTEYSAWAAAREYSCRREGMRKLTSDALDIASPEPGLWKKESWQFAIGETVQAQGWEAEIALLQRIPKAGAPSRFVPIRFAANNKLSGSDRTMAAFEAIALAKALGTKLGVAKIVHGDKLATFSVKAAAMSRAVCDRVFTQPRPHGDDSVRPELRCNMNEFSMAAIMLIVDMILPIWSMACSAQPKDTQHMKAGSIDLSVN